MRRKLDVQAYNRGNGTHLIPSTLKTGDGLNSHCEATEQADDLCGIWLWRFCCYDHLVCYLERNVTLAAGHFHIAFNRAREVLYSFNQLGAFGSAH